MNKLETIIGDYPTFINHILGGIAARGISFDDIAFIDHLGFRTTSMEEYEQEKKRFATVAKLINETIVNKRPISTFKLYEPIIHTHIDDPWRIRVDILELISPKTGVEFKRGLDHFECVTYDDLPTFMEKYPDVEFGTRSLNRGVNPELELKIDDEHSAKFHMQSLAAAVELQRLNGITEIGDGLTLGDTLRQQNQP